MPLTKLHFILLGIVFLLLPQLSHSQKQSSIRLHFYPYMQEIGDLSSRYSSSPSTTVNTYYEETPHFELGFLYHHQTKSKFGWAVGFSWKEATTKIQFRIDDFYDSSRALTDYKNETYRKFLRLNFSSSFLLNQKISFNLGLSIEAAPNVHMKGKYRRQGGVFSQTTQFQDGQAIATIHQGYNYELRTEKYLTKIVPELNMNVQLVKRLNLQLGFRFKFWKSRNYNHYAQVSGAITSATEQIIIDYRSAHDKREFSLYSGLTYTLVLPKLKKIMQ